MRRLALVLALGLVTSKARADAGPDSEAPRAIFEYGWTDAEFLPHEAEYPVSVEEYQWEGAGQAVRDFPVDWLHDLDDAPAVLVPPASCGWLGPCVWGGRVVVARVALDVDYLTVWRRGRDLEWMYAHRIGPGNYRFSNGRKSWWVCRDRRSIQTARRYPEDPVEVRAEIRRVQGFEPDDDDIQARIYAGRRLNSDVETFLAKGLDLEAARLATQRVWVEIATQLGLAYFRAFAIAHSTTQLARDVGADMERGLVALAPDRRGLGRHASEVDPIARKPTGPSDLVEYEFDQMHPGPLPPSRAQNFYGMKYNELVLARPTRLYRLGEAGPGKQFGGWYVRAPATGGATRARIDGAIRAVWQNLEDAGGMDGTKPYGAILGRSPLQVEYTIEFPAGTKVYAGPVRAQGSAFLGGPEIEQIFVPDAWKIGKVVASRKIAD